MSPESETLKTNFPQKNIPLQLDAAMFMAHFGFLSNMPISSRVKFVSSVRLRVQRFSGPWQIIIEEREEDKKCGVGEICRRVGYSGQ